MNIQIPSTSDTAVVGTVLSASFVDPQLLGLIGVVTGALIAILGNLILSKRQAAFTIQKEMFIRRLDVYVKMIALLWGGKTPQQSTVLPPDGSQDLSNYVTSNLLLIDTRTVIAYTELTTAFSAGRMAEVDELRKKLHECACQYFFETYHVELSD
jgi:hypothetical protein